MKPIHLFATAGAVIAAVIAAPFIKERVDEAYPDPHTRYGQAFEKCVEQGESRWDRKGMRVCIIMLKVRKEY